tara:strand:- start:1554 stop:2330 length:777 start_codon:yes stop_codon:yes gene_type:complete
MGARILYDTDTWDAAAISSNSETGDLVDDNVIDDDVSKVWRTTGDTSEWIVFDLGAAAALDMIGIFGHNLTAAATVTLQGHTADSWGAPDFSQTLEVVTDEDSVVIPKIVEFFTSTSKRYWRVLIADAANPDTYIQIGRIKAGAYYEPARSINERFSIMVVDPSEGQEEPGITPNFRSRTEYERISVAHEFASTTQRKEFRTLYRKVGKRVPVILSVDPTNEPTELSWFARIVSGLPVRAILDGQYNVGTLVYSEVVE